MAKGHWVYRNGKAIPVEKAGRGKPRIQIISDEMAETWHPADGKHYSSRRKFRDVTKMYGCVELGDEPFRPQEIPEVPGRKEEILRAYDSLSKGQR